MAGLFADVDEDGSGGAGADFRGKSGGSGGGGAKRSQRYVAGAFAESLAKLTALLDQTSQSFVRCVKPNVAAEAENFDGVMVLDQLRCMGMLELVAARARGYAYPLPERNGFASVPLSGGRRRRRESGRSALDGRRRREKRSFR